VVVRCGQYSVWSGDIHSSHNSQHVLDPYSFTHILHGVALYGLLARGIPRLSLVWRLCLGTSIEALWEVVENSEAVIQRYREATVSLGYHGDTVANSLGDILSCCAGFALARQLGPRGSLVLYVATEVGLLLWIRDNLTLNVVMLIHPIDAIKKWQMGQ
jgi:Protein of unknown function (DUF2585)